MEECEEEEIIIESEDDEEDNAEGVDDRSITPTPIQDFGANVVYSETCKFSDQLCTYFSVVSLLAEQSWSLRGVHVGDISPC